MACMESCAETTDPSFGISYELGLCTVGGNHRAELLAARSRSVHTHNRTLAEQLDGLAAKRELIITVRLELSI